MASGLANSVKVKGEPPLVVVTHPSGQPGKLRRDVAERLVKRGWKMGYDPKKAKGTTKHPVKAPAK